MYRGKKKRIIILVALIILLGILTVGYAAFESKIKVKGNAKVTSNWDIRITNIVEAKKTGSAESAVSPTWTHLTAYMEADLYEKGDSVEYEVTIENKGTLDAKLDNIISNIKSNNEATTGLESFQMPKNNVILYAIYKKQLPPIIDNVSTSITTNSITAVVSAHDEETDIIKYEFSINDGEYIDVSGLCKVASISEIEEKGWSLTPGAYVGVAPVEDDGVDFGERMKEIHKELVELQAESNDLMDTISKNLEEMGLWNMVLMN